MRLRADTWIHGTAAPMGCEVRLWDSAHRADLVLARPVGNTAAEPGYLASNLEPSLDLVWAYCQGVDRSCKAVTAGARRFKQPQQSCATAAAART
jgi:hypothetical protein